VKVVLRHLRNGPLIGSKMPRSRMSKIDIEARVYKMKTALYNGEHRDKSGEWHDGAHHALSQVLDILGEYSS
jgi:hypothetical protein